MVTPLLLGLVLLFGLLVLLPARRLQLAGLSAQAIGSYALLLWIAGVLVALWPGSLRVLLPILLIAYVAPFVVAPDRLGSILRRGGPGGPGGAGRGPGGRPIKDVTPPSERTREP